MRRKASWSDNTYVGETNVIEFSERIQMNIEEKIENSIEDIEYAYRSGDITENKMVMELNKLYVTNFLGNKINFEKIKISSENKMKLYFAYQCLSGESYKRERRRNILLGLVK